MITLRLTQAHTLNTPLRFQEPLPYYICSPSWRWWACAVLWLGVCPRRTGTTVRSRVPWTFAAPRGTPAAATDGTTTAPSAAAQASFAPPHRHRTAAVRARRRCATVGDFQVSTLSVTPLTLLRFLRVPESQGGTSTSNRVSCQGIAVRRRAPAAALPKARGAPAVPRPKPAAPRGPAPSPRPRGAATPCATTGLGAAPKRWVPVSTFACNMNV